MGSSINLDTIGIRLAGDDLQTQRKAVADLLEDRVIRFPGAQPVSFARRHLLELQNVDYFMCEKTDGVRCLLFLTQIPIEGEVVEAQFLIDRKNDYYYLPRETLHLPRRVDDLFNHHTGTLLDGELVQQSKNGQKKLAYLIFDCLAMDGENVTVRPFDKRLARIDQFVWHPLRAFAKQYPEDVAAQPFQVEMKKMEYPYAAEMMFRERIPNLPHGNDGLIFTCKSTAYKTGTDDHILKWKPPHENTIDFRLILGDFPMLEDEDGAYPDWDAKPAMELHINHGDGAGKGYKWYDNLTVTDAEWSAMKRLNEQLDGRIIECYKDAASGRWRPKVEKDGSPRFRDDKKDANHVSVAASVQESIDDAVTEQDLIAPAMKIRDAFKARVAREVEEQKRNAAAELERKRRHEAAAKAQHEQVNRTASETMEYDDNDANDGPTYED